MTDVGFCSHLIETLDGVGRHRMKAIDRQIKIGKIKLNKEGHRDYPMSYIQS